MNKLRNISLLALILSIIACIITWLRVDITFTNNAFISIMTGFIGICATFIAGLQIYNSIETRNSINELKKTFNEKTEQIKSDYDYKIKEMDTLISKLNSDLEEHKKQFEENNSYIKTYIKFAGATAFYTNQPYTSYRLFYECLEYMLEKQNYDDIKVILNNLEAIVKSIKHKSNLSSIDMDKILLLDFNSLKKYSLFSLIEDRFSKIHSEIMDIINKQVKTN